MLKGILFSYVYFWLMSVVSKISNWLAWLGGKSDQTPEASHLLMVQSHQIPIFCDYMWPNCGPYLLGMAQVACEFADLHDRAGRMKAVGAVRESAFAWRGNGGRWESNRFPDITGVLVWYL